MTPVDAYVVSHTHWDREWYQPFQEFRVRLVRMLDDLLDLLAGEPAFRCFMLDGQTIALEDYLAICPDRVDEVRALVRAQRLLIGPWYVLPDEFLVQPEALVRNLMVGRRIAARYGAAMPVGYIPDTFGHISQLPQIFAGFGIDNAVLWRGLPALPNEFRWQAPDGTTALAVNLREGYGNLAWAPGDPDGYAATVRRAVDQLKPSAPSARVLLMDGTDHLQARPDLPLLLDAANARLQAEVHLIHASLPEYLAVIRAAAPPLETVTGEFRSPSRSNVLPGVLSTRMWIKQRNRATETALTRWAEPFSAFATYGERLPGDLCVSSRNGLLRAAWELLLQNQPHDSICGSSIDQVHEEMRARYDQADQIAEQVTVSSLDALAAQIDTADETAGSDPPAAAGLVQPAASIPIVVFNPTGSERSEAVTLSVQIPSAWPGYELVDDAGNTIPVQVGDPRRLDWASLGIGTEEILDRVELEHGERIVGQAIVGLDCREEGATPVVTVLFSAHAQPDRSHVLAALTALRARLAGRTPRLEVSLVPSRELAFVAHVPPLGYATYRLRRAESVSRVSTMPPGLSVENEFWHVEADPVDGTLVVQDRQTGAIYRGWNRFEDEGDRGDLYNFCPVERDVTVRQPNGAPEIRVVESGPVRATLEIRMRYRIPAGLDESRRARLAERVAMPIVTRVTLVRGVPRVDVATTIENRARDHRLRVAFPTPVHADVFRTDTPFDVVERPLDLPRDTAAWQEQPVATQPQLLFADVSDARGGLLVANRGLPEIEARREGGGTALVLTLLRCVGWLSREDLAVRRGHAGPGLETPGAQCLGTHTFHYALVPHTGNWQAAMPHAVAFNAPVRARVTGRHGGARPARLSFVSARPGGIEIAAVKSAEEGQGMIVRVWNPASEPVQATLQFRVPVERVSVADLAERVVEPLALNPDRTVRLPLRPKQVATVRVENARRES